MTDIIITAIFTGIGLEIGKFLVVKLGGHTVKRLRK